MIVWVASYPRSGNSYVRLLLRQYYGIYVYSRYDDGVLLEMLGSPPRPISLDEMAASPDTFFVKTHELPEDDAAAIYLVRDGRDALVSYAHFILRYERPEENESGGGSFQDVLRQLVVGNAHFGGWGSHVRAWTERAAPTAVLKFEELITSAWPLPLLEGALNAIGHPPPPVARVDDPPAFSELHERQPDFFRRGRIGGWRSEWPPDLLESFWNAHGAAMYAHSYSTDEQLAFFRERARERLEILRDLETRLQDREQGPDGQPASLEDVTAEKELPDDILNYEVREQERLLAAFGAALHDKDVLIRAYRSEAEAKESIIQRFQSSYYYWIINGPLGWLPGMRPLATRSKQLLHIFTPKLGILVQHPPRPLQVPRRYRTVSEHQRDQELPTISIVTPSYNQGRFIQRTLQSILEQGYPCLEYGVQDGGSQDNTPEVLAGYQRQLAFVETGPDRGQAHALNLGFARTRGEIMAYINSDDVLLPGALHFVADYFRAHPEVDVVYSHRVIIDEQDREIGRWVFPPHDDPVLSWADYVPQETVFWRRRIWDRAGSEMNENYQYVLDWDLLLRFRAAGARFARLPRFLAAFRLHTRSKTSLELERAALIEMNRLRAQIHGREVSWPEIKQAIAPYLRRSLLYHIAYRLRILRA